MIAGKRAHQPGFTLIELIITLLIIGVLATIAVPGFQSLIASNRQVTAYNEILGGFKLARSEAITRREEITAKLEPQDRGWRLVVENEAGESILNLDSSSDGVNISADLEVTFDSLGRRESCDPDPNECHVVISGKSPDNSGGLGISPAGRIGKPEKNNDDQESDGENKNDGDDENEDD